MRRQAMQDPYQLVGTFVGSYQVREFVAMGGRGAIYRAQRSITEELVALKVLRPNNPMLVESFLKEAEMLANLSHPSIIRITDVGLTNSAIAKDTAFLAMEWIDGHTLKDELEEQGPMPLNRVSLVIGQICEALAYIHDKHIVHRDIKPANIMIASHDGKETVKVADFGVAKVLSSTGEVQSGFLGSPCYSAPEQLSGIVPDQRSDIYSVGVIAYQMITGKLPFTFDIVDRLLHRHLLSLPTPLRRLRPDAPKSMENAVHIALAKNPDNRFVDIREFARAFRHATKIETDASYIKIPRVENGRVVSVTSLCIQGQCDRNTQDLMFDVELERIASLPIKEVRAKLRHLGIEPAQTLPPYIRELRAKRTAQKSETLKGNSPRALPITPLITATTSNNLRIAVAFSLQLICLSLLTLMLYLSPSAPSPRERGLASTPTSPPSPQTLRIWIDYYSRTNEKEFEQSVSDLMGDLKNNLSRIERVDVTRLRSNKADRLSLQTTESYSWGAYPRFDNNERMLSRKQPGFSNANFYDKKEIKEAITDKDLQKARDAYEEVVNSEIARLHIYLLQRQKKPTVGRCTMFNYLGKYIASEGAPLNLVITDGLLDCPKGKTKDALLFSNSKLLIILLAGNGTDANWSINYANREHQLKEMWPKAQIIPFDRSGKAISTLIEY